MKGSIVATNFVDRNAGGEGATLKNGFFVVDFGEFLVDLDIGEKAELKDFGANGDFFDESGEDI